MSYVLNPGSGSGTIGGTIAEDQIAYGSATDTITGSDNLKYDPSAKKVTVKTDGVTDTVVLESTDAGSADHAPDLKLYRNSASPATNDKLGEIRFAGNKSDGSEYSVTKITTEMNTLDSSDRLTIDVASSGGSGHNNYEYMRFDGGIRDIVFNETGVDIDFRIEGQNNQDLFLTDASQDAVAIGIPLGSMTSTLFQVGGPMSITSANSVSNLDIKFSADTNTGVFSPGADQISFAVAGADALGVGANKNVTVGGSSGTAGQVLTSGGSGAATTWTTISGGSGMVPRGQAYQSTNSYQEILGLTSGINIEQASVNTTSNWDNSSARWRPHCFSETGALGTVNITLVSNSLTSGTRTFNFGIWNMDADGKITTKKATTKIEITSATSTGQLTSDAWSAEAGEDTNVTAGEWYWIAFDGSGGGGSCQVAFFNSARVHSAGVKFDGVNTTFYQTLYELFASVTSSGDNPTVSAGDTSGTTWIIAGLNIT